MVLYIAIILTAIVAVTLGNVLSVPFEWSNLWWILLNTSISAVSAIAIDGVCALLVRRALPSSWFLPHRRLFVVSKRERNFYRALRIKAWKDYVPELGVFTGFNKSELKSTSDAEYLKRFLMEINYGAAGHIAGAIFGLCLCLVPCFCRSSVIFPSPWSIWLPVFAVNFVLSLLPTFILRYTSYTLYRLYNKQLKREDAGK